MIPDEELAGLVQHGDADALEQLVRRYLRPVLAVVASYLPEPADVEDAAQETFLRALRGITGPLPGSCWRAGGDPPPCSTRRRRCCSSWPVGRLLVDGAVIGITVDRHWIGAQA